MLHKNSENPGVPIPEAYITSDAVYWVLVLSKDGLSHLKTWEERAIAWHEFKDHKLPKQPHAHKLAHYLILFDILSDGTGVWIEYPTRSGWSDFIWSLSSYITKVDGQSVLKVSYYDIAAILWMEKRANPTGFEHILRLLQQYSETAIKPDATALKAYKGVTGNDMEHLFAAVGIGYIEQWNKNPVGLQMDMSYGLYPPTRERVAQSINMREGKLTLFWSLHQALTNDMKLSTVMSMIKDRWKYTPKDKSKGIKFYKSDGYLSGVDGPAHIVYTRTKELVFALGKDNADIFLDNLDLAPGELRIHIHEECNEQDSLEFWFNNDIKPFANSFDGTCAYFDQGYVRLDGSGNATVCLYQDWTEDEIVKTINRQQKMTKHKLEK